MKRIINNKGLSLVETLIGITLISVTGVGLFKISQQTILTSQVTETHRSTRQLKNQLYSALNHTDACNKLKPDQLSNPGDQTGELTDGFETLKVGNFGGSNLIEIVSMRLNPPLPDDTGNKRFYLYYKYNSPSLGAKQKRTDAPCTENDLSGCYYLSCEMQYDCTNDDCNDPNDKCMPLHCGFSGGGNSVSNVVCPEGKFLVGGTGQNSCVGCDDGEYLIGTKISDTGNPEAICLTDIACDDGYVAVGTKLESGEYKMDCMKLICPSGQYMALRPGENEGDPPVSKCERICHGGQVNDESQDNRCKCPGYMEKDIFGNCVCENGRELNAEGKCVCAPGRTANVLGKCVCGSKAYSSIRNNKCWCKRYPITDPGQPGVDDCECFLGRVDHRLNRQFNDGIIRCLEEPDPRLTID